MAIYSAQTEKPLPSGTCIIGELSLAGELRTVPKIKQRVKTAESLGFTHIFAPEQTEGAIEIKTISQLIKNAIS